MSHTTTLPSIFTDEFSPADSYGRREKETCYYNRQKPPFYPHGPSDKIMVWENGLKHLGDIASVSMLFTRHWNGNLLMSCYLYISKNHQTPPPYLYTASLIATESMTRQDSQSMGNLKCKYNIVWNVHLLPRVRQQDITSDLLLHFLIASRTSGNMPVVCYNLQEISCR